MKVTQAEFIISAVGPKQYPEDALPEIALAGRSNVGKSSFINKMLNRKSLARTSSKPGKTQTLNFFKINNTFYFVDVPGYGFARVSKTEKEKWGNMIEEYFTSRKELKTAIQLIDVRHPPTKDDQAMYSFLKHYEIPVIIIATKVDKISKGQWQKHEKIVRETLQMDKADKLVLFSSETGQGKDEAWKMIIEKINNPVAY
jgi:GTP-binding protein